MSGNIGEQHVAAFLSGDPNALDDETLVAFINFAMAVIKFRYGRKVREADLEDLALTAVEAAWASRRDFAGKSALATWLSRIILRTVYKHRTSRKGEEQSVSLDPGSECGGDGWKELQIATPHDTQETVRLRLLWEHSETILSPRQLEAFQMSRQGFSETEIGEALGGDAGVAKQLIKAARKKLRRVFGAATDDGTGGVKDRTRTDDAYD